MNKEVYKYLIQVNMKITQKELLKTYTPEKRGKDKTQLLVYYVLRRVFFWITPAFLKFKLKN